MTRSEITEEGDSAQQAIIFGVDCFFQNRMLIFFRAWIVMLCLLASVFLFAEIVGVSGFAYHWNLSCWHLFGRHFRILVA